MQLVVLGAEALEAFVAHELLQHLLEVMLQSIERARLELIHGLARAVVRHGGAVGRFQ